MPLDESEIAPATPHRLWGIKLRTLKTLGLVGAAWVLVVFERGFGRCGFSHSQRLFRIDKRVAEVKDGRWSFVSAISLLMHA